MLVAYTLNKLFFSLSKQSRHRLQEEQRNSNEPVHKHTAPAADKMLPEVPGSLSCSNGGILLFFSRARYYFIKMLHARNHIYKVPNGNNERVASDKLHINLSLPRFTYNYEVKDFKAVLKKLGIVDAFDEAKADFTKIIDNNELYVGEAIHKTKIELNEVGTKAAAVTYFGMFAKGMAPQDFEQIDIVFNKPFVYMIREKNTGEILFFGTVFEPNTWKGTTCSNQE